MPYGGPARRRLALRNWFRLPGLGVDARVFLYDGDDICLASINRALKANSVHVNLDRAVACSLAADASHTDVYSWVLDGSRRRGVSAYDVV